MKRSLLSPALFALVFSCAVLQCQQLTMQNDSGKQMILSRLDIEALPQAKVTAAEHSSGSVNFEGVTLTRTHLAHKQSRKPSKIAVVD